MEYKHIYLIAVLFAVLSFGAYIKKQESSGADYSKAVCAGPPLSVEERMKAVDEGYGIDMQYGCITKVSFEAVNRQKAEWQKAHANSQTADNAPRADAGPKPEEHRDELQEALRAREARDYAKALRLFEPLAERGNPTAQLMLGDMYHSGLGVTKDDAVAYSWNRKAAEQGDAHAQALLGVMHQEGWGTPKDDTEAARWFTLSAEQGYVTAQFTLGLIYLNGRGVPRDDSRAIDWIRKSAQGGNADAQTLLGMAYHEGQAGLARDDAQARVWLSKAANQGNANARAALPQLGR